MEKVAGIGGVFFRAKDPSALQGWYAEHLGVEPPPKTYEEPVWRQEAGPTVFAAFAESAVLREPRPAVVDQLPRTPPRRHGRPA